MTYRASLSLAALLVLPLACVPAPERSAEADKNPAASVPTPDADQPAEAKPKPAPTAATELSAEELELIAADPRALGPEQNRKRAFALRKQIMQNPDSPQAQALEEARAAALGGDLTLDQITPAPGSLVSAEPEPDPGLVIELPPHLQ